MKHIHLALPAMLAILCACPPGPDVGTPGTTTHTLSVMTANLRQTYNYPNPDSVGWRTRYSTIGAWMARNGVKPDIIALQEVSGWWWCPTNPHALADYESLAHLLNEIQANTGIRYRIAHLLVSHAFGESSSGVVEGAGTAGGCQTMGGNAILYNPQTVEHIADNGSRLNHDSGDTAIALRRSLPCCNVRAGDEWICGQIDGAADDEKCNSSPSGSAWSVETAGSLGALAQFRRVGGSHAFHVYNAHWWVGSEGYEHSLSQARAFVEAMEAQLGSADNWIPPLYLADFNIPEPSLPSSVWPEYFQLVSPDEGIDAIFQGNFLLHPARFVPRVASQGRSCELDGVPLSDHCFVWSNLTITEPN